MSDPQLPLSLTTWPSQGRIGKATKGDWASEYVFVFPETRGFWAFYSSGGTDDILPSSGWVDRRIVDAEIEWLDAGTDNEVAIEREKFGMRPIVHSQFDPPESIAVRLSHVWSRLRGVSDPSTDSAIALWQDRLREER